MSDMTRSSRSALNRLIVACRNELIPLDAAARAMGDPEHRARLRKQSRRRLIFLRDLGAEVVALGGVPAKRPSTGARLSSALRGFREVLAGWHSGDAYAACARATGKTARSYSTALESRLPGDVRFGLERQSAEIAADHGELRRLRWGAELTSTPKPRTADDAAPATRASAAAEERALQVWRDDGGPPAWRQGARL